MAKTTVAVKINMHMIYRPILQWRSEDQIRTHVSDKIGSFAPVQEILQKNRDLLWLGLVLDTNKGAGNTVILLTVHRYKSKDYETRMKGKCFQIYRNKSKRVAWRNLGEKLSVGTPAISVSVV